MNSNDAPGNTYRTISVSETRQSAEAAFSSGLYCAESVVLALAKAQGLDTDLLPKAATAFCSGMARTCGTCGALTGAILGVSLALGRNRADESVQDAYSATQQLVREFEQAFGARNCDALLGCDLGTPAGQRTFRDNHLHVRCAEYTGKAAEIAARVIAFQAGVPIEPVADLPEIRRFLSGCALPVCDITDGGSLAFFAYRPASELSGLVGLERCGSEGLLRSLAVSPACRGQGIGTRLVEHVEAHAASLGIQSLYLLTTTAEPFFARLGYSSTPRTEAPARIKATAQFSGVCPGSSSFMSKRLHP